MFMLIPSLLLLLLLLCDRLSDLSSVAGVKRHHVFSDGQCPVVPLGLHSRDRTYRDGSDEGDLSRSFWVLPSMPLDKHGRERSRLPSVDMGNMYCLLASEFEYSAVRRWRFRSCKASRE